MDESPDQRDDRRIGDEQPPDGPGDVDGDDVDGDGTEREAHHRDVDGRLRHPGEAGDDPRPGEVGRPDGPRPVEETEAGERPAHPQDHAANRIERDGGHEGRRFGYSTVSPVGSARTTIRSSSARDR